MMVTTARKAADADRLQEVRCRGCGRLLFKAAAVGTIETVCPDRDCKRFQTITLARTT